MLEEVFIVILKPLGLLLSRVGESDRLLGLLGCLLPMSQGSIAHSCEVDMLDERAFVSQLRVW